MERHLRHPADHDNDGVANLFEAYFGTHPWRAETGEPPIDLAVDQANGTITLSYKRIAYKIFRL